MPNSNHHHNSSTSTNNLHPTNLTSLGLRSVASLTSGVEAGVVGVDPRSRPHQPRVRTTSPLPRIALGKSATSCS